MTKQTLDKVLLTAGIITELSVAAFCGAGTGLVLAKSSAGLPKLMKISAEIGASLLGLTVASQASKCVQQEIKSGIEAVQEIKKTMDEISWQKRNEENFEAESV